MFFGLIDECAINDSIAFCQVMSILAPLGAVLVRFLLEFRCVPSEAVGTASGHDFNSWFFSVHDCVVVSVASTAELILVTAIKKVVCPLRMVS